MLWSSSGKATVLQDVGGQGNSYAAAINASDDRPAHDRNAFFAGGRFVPMGTISVEAAYAVPLERLADRILSMSPSSPERLGDEVPAMRSAMREALAPFAAAGVIDEIVEARAEVFDRVGENRSARLRLICNDRTGAGRSETRSRSNGNMSQSQNNPALYEGVSRAVLPEE